MKSRLFLPLTAIVLLMSFGTMFAQVKIGAKAGYSVGRLTDNSDNIYAGEYESSSGIDFGLTFEYPTSELFSLQMEFLITQRGGERNGVQPIPTTYLDDFGTIEELNFMLALQGKGPVTDENPMYADFNNTSELTYLEIPVLGKLGWGDTWRFYVEAGPYVGFLLSANQKTSGTSIITLDEAGADPLFVLNPNHDPSNPATGPLWVPLPPQTFDGNTDTKNDLNTYNFGFHAGTGLIRKLNEQHEVYVGFRGSWGSVPIQKNEVYGKSHIGGLVFSLGYAYTL